MTPLFDTVTALDKACVERYGMSEELMMEHAALAIKNVIEKNVDKGSSVLIVAGGSNNGADGLALARLLCGDYRVSVFCAYEPKGALAMLQYKRAKALDKITFLTLIEIGDHYDVVVDSLFGTGFSGALKTQDKGLLGRLNGLGGLKIACDIPSGISIDAKISSVCFKADVTVTMGAAKTALHDDATKDFVGEVVVADLGVPFDLYVRDFKPDALLLEESDMRLPKRGEANVHKGSFGHVCVIAGRMQGAAQLAANAALSFGCGLVTIVSEEKLNIDAQIMQSKTVPPTTTAISIGSGLGDIYSDELLASLPKNAKIVLDADLFYYKATVDFLTQREGCVLTPHPKEFASLLTLAGFGEFDAAAVQSDRYGLARRFSEKYASHTLILKGAVTLITNGGEVYVMPLGTSALAKGGSGDVLCGLVSALLAQGYEPLEAAKTATLAHASAARKTNVNDYALTPYKLIEAVGCL